jgi:hypothetical protein
MNLFIPCKHIFGLDNLYIGELGSRVEGRLGATAPPQVARLEDRG